MVLLRELFSRIEHKGLLATSIVAVLAVGGTYLSPSIIRSTANTQQTPTSRNSGPAVIGTIVEVDTDGDRLPDWQESLYGSDRNLIDTDKDGTNDGEEVLLGRDPTKAAPGDELLAVTDPNFATSSTDISALKKEFFTEYLSSEAREIRETTFRDLVAKFDGKKYSPAGELVDLKIISDNSVNAIQKYGNDFGAIIKRYKEESVGRTEEEIIEVAMRTKSSGDLKALQLPAITYRNLATELRSIEVPSIFARDHLNIVNGYTGMSLGLFGMQMLFTDPVEGAGAYEAYTKNRFLVTDGYAGVIRTIGDKQIAFEPNDPGYPFYSPRVPQ